MAMHDDGNGPALYIGGVFEAIDGQPLSKVARLRDGAWSALGSGVEPPGSIWSLISFGGDLIAVGNFQQIGGVAANNVARWDGRAWHAMGEGINGSTSADVALIFNGELLVGGGTGDGQPSAVKRWDGAHWQPLGALASGVNDMVVHAGSLIAAGGPVVRWTGAEWESIGPQPDFTVNALASFNGDLIATGSFESIGGVPFNRIARWDGASWHALGSGLNSTGHALTLHNGELIVGGSFTTAGGVMVNNLAQWDGTQWSSVAGGMGGDISSSPTVNALFSLNGAPSPTLMAGGWFTLAGGLCANNIAQLSDGQWSPLSECTECQGLSGPVRAMAVHDDGSGAALYVGGRSRCAGTTRIDRIARWDGRAWSSVGSGFDGAATVLVLTEFDDGSGARLYAGGFFTSVGGVAVSNIAAWDGNAWSSVGGGVSGGAVVSMAVFDDGDGPALYVGGTFTSAGGTPASKIAKWDGRNWSDVGGGLDGFGMVSDMLVWNDSSGDALVIGGIFNGVGGLVTSGAARWRDGAWHHLGQAWDQGAFVRTLATWPTAQGSALILGGDFVTPGSGFQRDGLALWDGAAFTSIAPGHAGQYDNFEGTFEMHATAAAGCNQLFLISLYSSEPTFLEDRLQVWNGDVWRPVGEGIADATGSYWHVAPLCCNWLIAYAGFAEFEDRLYVAGDFTLAGGQPASNIATWDLNAAMTCLGDVVHDGTVNIDDLLVVVSQWGPCKDCTGDPAPCGGDDLVNIDDLLAVISAWGPCP